MEGNKQNVVMILAIVVTICCSCVEASDSYGNPFEYKRNKKVEKPRRPDISGETKPISHEELQKLRSEIRTLIANDPELIPNWVQMSFHDCFGVQGCNGCLDLDNPNNKGLIETFNGVKDLFEELVGDDDKLSFADFVALLGVEAATAGIKASENFVEGSVNIPYSVGRQTCKHKVKDTGLPSGFQTNGIDILRHQFGLNTREAVALLGAHSLGKASPQNSGFEGPWDNHPLALDNGYFFALRFINWEPLKKDAAQSHQWNLFTNGEPSKFMMLHVDMALRKKFKTKKSDFDEPSCKTMDECEDNPSTLQYIVEFTTGPDSQKIFHEAFSKSYTKMINKSLAPLKLME